MKMEKAPLWISKERNCYSFEDPVYGKLCCGWEETLFLNNNEIKYSGFDNYGRLIMHDKHYDEQEALY